MQLSSTSPRIVSHSDTTSVLALGSIMDTLRVEGTALTSCRRKWSLEELGMGDRRRGAWRFGEC
ncbi:hypothetical protein BT69DRAFT_1284664 [Atractiella rhizophila]|nr:hypothetical protein BT69DRAFT_1284664 [Atractiella rhizophila]